MTRTRHTRGTRKSQLVRDLPGDKERQLATLAAQKGLTTRQAETARRLARLQTDPAIPADLPLASRGKKHASTRRMLAALERDNLLKRAGRVPNPPRPDLN